MTRVSVRTWARTVWGALPTRDPFYGTNFRARINSPSVDPLTATTTAPTPPTSSPPSSSQLRGCDEGDDGHAEGGEREGRSADSWKTIKHHDVIVLQTSIYSALIKQRPGARKLFRCLYSCLSDPSLLGWGHVATTWKKLKLIKQDEKVCLFNLKINSCLIN